VLPVSIDGAASFRVAAATGSALDNAPDWAKPVQWLASLKSSAAALSATANKAVQTLQVCLGDGNKQYEHRYMPEDVQQILTTPIPDPPAATISPTDEAAVFMRLAFAIVGQTWTPLLTWKSWKKPGEVMGGTNIGAVMIHGGKIIGWGINMLAQNRTFHAETVMRGAYIAAQGAVPANVHIYTTLQSCHMCA
jgi:hypothetical protein